MKTRALGVAAGAVALAGFVYWAVRAFDRDETTAAEVTSKTEPPPSAASGFELDLSFQHQSKTLMLEGVPSGQGPQEITIDAHVDLKGVLEVLPRGRAGGGRVIEIGFAKLERHVFKVGHAGLFDEPEITKTHLLDPRVLVELDADGRVNALRFPAGTSINFERVMQLVLGEMQFHQSDEASFTTSERTGMGEANVAYQKLDDRRWAKRRLSYTKLRALPDGGKIAPPTVDGRVEFELAEDGLWQRLQGRETVRVVDDGKERLRAVTEIHVARLGSLPRASKLALSAFTERRVFGEAAESDRFERQHLEQRIGDMTREKMLSNLREFGFGGKMPNHNEWCWQVTGLLRRDPALARELGLELANSKIGPKGRALVVDLLVGAATPEAQAVLRSFLAQKSGVSEREWRSHLQQMAQLRTPDRETIDFLVGTYEKTEGIDHEAASVTLGAAAGHLYRSGDYEGGRREADRLAKDLEEARDEKETATLVTALGNAGLVEQLPTLLGYASSGSESVRLRVATALRKTDAPEVRTTLLSLAQDPVLAVSIRALSTLGRLNLQPADIQALLQAMQSGQIQPDAFPTLVNTLSAYVNDPSAQAILRLIIAHPGAYNELKARCRSLLGL